MKRPKIKLDFTVILSLQWAVNCYNWIIESVSCTSVNWIKQFIKKIQLKEWFIHALIQMDIADSLVNILKRLIFLNNDLKFALFLTRSYHMTSKALNMANESF